MEEITINDSLGSYFKDIRKCKPLSLEREMELARIIQSGSRDAQKAVDELVTANLRFAVTIARQYQGRGMELQDLIDEANIGLIKAAWKFDGSLGFRFISYAVWWIRQAIMESCCNQSRTVRIPMNKIGAISMINKVIARVEQETGKKPGTVEIAKEVGLTESEVDSLLRVSAQTLSLNKTFSSDEDDEAGSLEDLIPSSSYSDDIVVTDDLNRNIRKVMRESLTARECFILECYFGFETGIEMDLEAIAKRLNVTGERIRQLRDLALKKLRKSSNLDLLRDFLG